MSSKFNCNKDINNRLKFEKNKNHYRIFQLLLNDLYIPIENRQVSSYCYIYNKKEAKLKSLLKNKCIISGRNRSVYSFFKVTRMIFKKLAVRSYMPGLRKHSW